ADTRARHVVGRRHRCWKLVFHGRFATGLVADRNSTSHGYEELRIDQPTPTDQGATADRERVGAPRRKFVVVDRVSLANEETRLEGETAEQLAREVHPREPAVDHAAAVPAFV